jgi:hypothetical protein
MTVTLVIDFMKLNLAGPQDKSKCMAYIDSLELAPHDLDYAKSMLDRWISVKMFKKPLAGQVSTPCPTTVQTKAPSQTPNAVGRSFLKDVFEYMEAHRSEHSSEQRLETLVSLLQESRDGGLPAPGLPE